MLHFTRFATWEYMLVFDLNCSGLHERGDYSEFAIHLTWYTQENNSEHGNLQHVLSKGRERDTVKSHVDVIDLSSSLVKYRLIFE